MKMKQYGSFDEYQADQSAANQSIIRLLRSFVRKALPSLREAMVCGKCFWVARDTPIACVSTASDHLQFAFGAGASLRDPTGILEGKGNKYARHVKIRSSSDIDESALAEFLRQAVKIGDPLRPSIAPGEARTEQNPVEKTPRPGKAPLRSRKSKPSTA